MYFSAITGEFCVRGENIQIVPCLHLSKNKPEKTRYFPLFRTQSPPIFIYLFRNTRDLVRDSPFTVHYYISASRHGSLLNVLTSRLLLLSTNKRSQAEVFKVYSHYSICNATKTMYTLHSLHYVQLMSAGV